jgi:predicted membrane chloride channel (bestrophin family)
MPILMLSFVQNELLGFVLNSLTVMCFTGLHEVARELENPFQNVPNDLPLNNFQGQFNEGLMSIFKGYHPDAYWEVATTPRASDDPLMAGEEEGTDVTQ